MNYVMTYGYNGKSLIRYIENIDIISYFLYTIVVNILLIYYKIDRYIKHGCKK